MKEKERKEIIGKLERVKRFGIFRDLEIIVNGQKFYKRTPSKEIPKNIRYQLGKKELIGYEETTTITTEWIADKLFFACFKIPRHYNQIKEVRLI